MLKYYRDGRAIYESAGTTVKDEATALLKKREGAIANGARVSKEKLRFEDAAANLVNDYKINHRRSLDELERRLRLHLQPFFGNGKLASLTTARIRAFVAHRQEVGIVATRGPRKGQRIGDVSNAELNRELTVLNACSPSRSRTA